VTGPVNREGETIANGTIRVTGLRAGTYRVRVEHVRFITLEREVTPPPEPEPVEAPPPDPAQADTPPGEPRTLVVADFVEKNFIGSRDPIKEDELGCTASARTRLVQLRESTKEESSPDADEVIYVVAGEGTLRLGNKDVPLDSSALAVVPRGTARSLSRKGRNPLIVLSVVSGPSCTGQAGQAGQ
jgi:mannose-6-phosphate isomerase-like protein (cupin superfamily)